MHRQPLLNLLAEFRQSVWISDIEVAMLDRMEEFVRNETECFERTLLKGHMTGSAFILNHKRDLCLLMHHKKLGRWFQPGGHADGDADLLRVAGREASEETGIEDLKLIVPGIFDVDVHPIPARAHEAEHIHYDVRFLFEAGPGSNFVMNEESNELRWVPLNEVQKLDCSASVLRMVNKVVSPRGFEPLLLP